MCGDSSTVSADAGASEYPQRARAPVGKLISAIYKDRLKQLYSKGQWENVNLLAAVTEGILAGAPHVRVFEWSAPGQTRPSFEHVMKQKFKPSSLGRWFGPSWSTHWFRVELTVSEEFRDKDHLEFHWDSSNEAMVWTDDGTPLQGLTGGGERTEWILPKSFRDGKTHTIYLETACQGMFGNAPGGDLIQPPKEDKFYQLSKAEIVAINTEARQLHMDMWIIHDAALEFPDTTWEQHKALDVGTRIMNTYVTRDKESVLECRRIAQEILGPDVSSDKVYKNGKDPLVWGIGHCHIDSCWLWPWAETRRKVARSWSSQCDLMDRYPEHKFACSQAQQYKWLKQDYPYIWNRIKAKVDAGQFNPIGGSWVEHDTNMPSGESLVRQFIHGQRFFESHFGQRCRTFWLPDTFGYSAQLPQLCRLAGMERFFTQKLSWNNINKFPHTTFNWVGLDGSQVVTHMTPAETYTSEAHFGDVKRCMEQHKSKDQDITSLLVFGRGDGGGGPTWEHLEKLRRCRGLADNLGILPRVHMGATVDDFFDQLMPKADNFVTWYGELYFELHRGTYTTQANNKKYNRRAEFLLRDVELLATIASIKEHSYKYPKKDLDSMWEGVLLCQFHDCLPGSSIGMCYDDSDKVYAEVFETGSRLIEEIGKVLGFAPDTNGPELLALNTLPWARRDTVRVGRDVFTANSSDLGTRLYAAPLTEPDYAAAVSLTEDDGAFVMENGLLRLRVENGSITSLFDIMANREVIVPGEKANQLVLFQDQPLYWQAWDVEVYHLDTRRELEAGKTRVLERTAHRVTLETETRISEASTARTTITLSAAMDGRPSLVECECHVDWHETMKFLKVEFPVDVVGTEAAYETQFGLVRRPTHYNTSWDHAKFEVCCHKFADLSEDGYGVSVINDSKYGFATCGKVMRLSLLRAPKAPDAEADMGQHTMRWALMPHSGGLGVDTVRAAYEFNNPLMVVRKLDGASPQAVMPVRLRGDEALVLDTVKRGEDDDHYGDKGACTIVLRLYESLGGRRTGSIEVDWPVEKVSRVNLLEDELEEVGGWQTTGSGCRFEFVAKPFEVLSFKLQLKG